MNTTTTLGVSKRSAAIGIVVLMAVTALAIVPMYSEDSEAATDLGVYTGGTNLSNENAFYSGLDFNCGIISKSTVFYVSLGATINMLSEKESDGLSFRYYDGEQINDLGLRTQYYVDDTMNYGVNHIVETVSGYGTTSCYYSSWFVGSPAIYLVCLDPNGVTDLGTYFTTDHIRTYENLSSERAAYSKIDTTFSSSRADMGYETFYVTYGAQVDIYANEIYGFSDWDQNDLGLEYEPRKDAEWTINSLTGTVSGYGTFEAVYEGDTGVYGYTIICLAPSHTVTFDSNGGSDVPNQVTDSNGYVTAPEDPVLADHIFAGWYTDEGEPFDFSQPISSDITLHAQWVDELIFTTEPTSEGSIKAVFGMPGTILCDASGSSDYTSILWDLGDGTTSTNTYVTHYYSNPGTYEVTLTVFNEHGTDVTTYTVEVPESSTWGGGHDHLLLYIAVGLLAALLIAVVALRLL